MGLLQGWSKAIGLVLIGAVLVACSGQQSAPETLLRPIGDRNTAGSNGDLAYIASSAGYIYAYTIPDGKLVQKFPTPYVGAPLAMCSDSSGSVYLTAMTDPPPANGVIYKYERGGTTPVATYEDPNYRPYSCSIDPTTGNLAVTNWSESGGNVAIYSSATSAPIYYTTDFADYLYCDYDSSGNLYVDGIDSGLEIAVLKKGSTGFNAINLKGSIKSTESLQWAAGFLNVTSHHHIYRIKIEGLQGKIASKHGMRKLQSPTWIQGSVVVGRYKNGVAFWDYPSGGDAIKILKGIAFRSQALTISVPPTH